MGAAPFQPGQIVTVFRSRLRDDPDAGPALDEYDETADEMEALGRAMPGFVDFKTFRSDDGERVSLVTFADAGSQAAWRTHVEHRAAQRAGRDRFYGSYTIQVCECRSARSFDRAATADGGGPDGTR